MGPAQPAIGGIASYIDGVVQSNLAEKYEIHVLNIATIRKRPINYGKSKLTAKSGLDTLRIVWNFIIVIYVFRPDIIHICSSSYFGFYEKTLLAMIARVLGKKVLFHVMGGGIKDFYDESSIKPVIRGSFCVPNKIAVMSVSWSEWLKQIVPERKICILPNAIKMHEQVYNKSQLCKFVFLGALQREKGVYDIVQAADTLKKSIGSEFQIIFVGGGPEFDELGKQVRKGGLSDIIELTGQISIKQKEKYLNSAHCLLLPSYAEGFPTVLLEGMAAGLFVIATPVGAIPEVVKNGKGGILVQPGDVESLCRSMETVVLNVESYSLLGMKNIKIVRENFSWDVVGQLIDNIYRDLAGM